MNNSQQNFICQSQHLQWLCKHQYPLVILTPRIHVYESISTNYSQKKKKHKIWHPIKIDGRNQFASAVEKFLTRVAPNIIELTSNKQIIYSISKLNSVRVRASRYNTRCDAMPCAGRASGARFPPICRARRPPRPLIKIISTWIRHDGPNT